MAVLTDVVNKSCLYIKSTHESHQTAAVETCSNTSNKADQEHGEGDHEDEDDGNQTRLTLHIVDADLKELW